MAAAAYFIGTLQLVLVFAHDVSNIWVAADVQQRSAQRLPCLVCHKAARRVEKHSILEETQSLLLKQTQRGDDLLRLSEQRIFGGHILQQAANEGHQHTHEHWRWSAFLGTILDASRNGDHR